MVSEAPRNFMFQNFLFNNSVTTLSRGTFSYDVATYAGALRYVDFCSDLM